MKRLKEIPLDPLTFYEYSGNGYPSAQLLYEDEYFAEAPTDSELGSVLDHVVEMLPTVERQCVKFRVYERLTYAEIARELGWYCGSPPYPNRKRAWSTTRRGLARLRSILDPEGTLQ